MHQTTKLELRGWFCFFRHPWGPWGPQIIWDICIWKKLQLFFGCSSQDFETNQPKMCNVAPFFEEELLELGQATCSPSQPLTMLTQIGFNAIIQQLPLIFFVATLQCFLIPIQISFKFHEPQLGLLQRHGKTQCVLWMEYRVNPGVACSRSHIPCISWGLGLFCLYTVTKSADFGFIPLLWLPRVPRGV